MDQWQVVIHAITGRMCAEKGMMAANPDALGWWFQLFSSLTEQRFVDELEVLRVLCLRNTVGLGVMAQLVHLSLTSTRIPHGSWSVSWLLCFLSNTLIAAWKSRGR